MLGRIKTDDNMKSLSIKIKQAKKKNFDKIKETAIELVKLNYANNPDKLEQSLKVLNEYQVVDLDLHETRKEM